MQVKYNEAIHKTTGQNRASKLGVPEKT